MYFLVNQLFYLSAYQSACSLLKDSIHKLAISLVHFLIMQLQETDMFNLQLSCTPNIVDLLLNYLKNRPKDILNIDQWMNHENEDNVRPYLPDLHMYTLKSFYTPHILVDRHEALEETIIPNIFILLLKKLVRNSHHKKKMFFMQPLNHENKVMDIQKKIRKIRYLHTMYEASTSFYFWNIRPYENGLHFCRRQDKN